MHLFFRKNSRFRQEKKFSSIQCKILIATERILLTVKILLELISYVETYFFFPFQCITLTFFFLSFI
jgi:hypothetical protein